eukprot:gene26259-32986_t
MDGAENSDGSVPTLADGTTFAVTALPQITLTDEQETHRNTVFAVGGKDQFDSLAVDYHAAYSRATFSKGYNFGAKFYGPKNTPVDYNNILDAKYPTFSYPNGFDPNNASNYKLNSLSGSSEFDVDEEYTYAANAEWPLHLLQSDDRLKFGAEARLRTKTVATYSLTGLTVP